MFTSWLQSQVWPQCWVMLTRSHLPPSFTGTVQVTRLPTVGGKMFPPLTTVSEMGLASVEGKRLGLKIKSANITPISFFSWNIVIEKAISGRGLHSFVQGRTAFWPFSTCCTLRFRKGRKIGPASELEGRQQITDRQMTCWIFCFACL